MVSAPQEMTSQAETAKMATPTLTYGEVGETQETILKTVPYRAQGPGFFKAIEVLERMALVANINWTSASSGQLSLTDICAFLATLARNNDVMQQFVYFRAGVEVTIRINTTQFYYGALMASLWPTNGTGNRFDERAVLDPTIISASVANAVVKKLDYQYPSAWMNFSNAVAGGYPMNLSLDVLCPLKVTSSTAPETVSVQIWARFVDVELCYPGGTLAKKSKKKRNSPRAQSGVPKVKFPTKGKIMHPVDESDLTSALVDVIRSGMPKEGGNSSSMVDQLLSWAPLALGAAAMFLDKPDKSASQTAIIQEPQIDEFNADIEDTNVSLSLYKQRYLDPSPSRIPMGRNMTVSDYARIPGIVNVNSTGYLTISAAGNSFTVPLMSAHSSSADVKKPLDWAYVSSCKWRGSIKLMIQAFTSAFISTRLAIQYYNNYSTGGGPPTDYTSGLTSVMDIKGDTTHCLTLPYLNEDWWSSNHTPFVTISVISDIVSPDQSGSPIIYLVLWAAGGEDIQFAYPRVPASTQWVGLNPVKEAQCSIGEMFSKTFEPLGQGSAFQTDTGLCTTEQLGPIVDICKRYSPLITVGTKTPVNGVPFWILDCTNPASANPSNDYLTWYRYRMSLYGMWRQCFLYQSGGYRYRAWHAGTESVTYTLKTNLDGSQNQTINGTYYFTPPDKVSRMTVPQTTSDPYRYLTNSTTSSVDFFNGMSLVTSAALNANTVELIAARDDLQFGFPILPAGMVAATLMDEEVKGKEKPSKPVLLSSQDI